MAHQVKTSACAGVFAWANFDEGNQSRTSIPRLGRGESLVIVKQQKLISAKIRCYTEPVIETKSYEQTPNRYRTFTHAFLWT